MIRRRNVLTAAELQGEVDSWSDNNVSSDEEDNGRYANKINVIISPPDAVDNISDYEELDDNVNIINEDNQLPREMAGHFEIEYHYNDDNMYCRTRNGDVHEEERNDEPEQSTLRGNRRTDFSELSDNYKKPNWNRRANYKFEKQPFDDTKITHKVLYEKIGSYTPLQLWECFVDDEVLRLIVDCTNLYAGQNNIPGFVTTINEIRTFLGILYITGYHTLPNINSYWSNSASLGCKLIKDAMSRDRFKRIKQNLHVCDNGKLNKNDKFSKVSPLNDLMNIKFMQFGVFSHNLSIDEQMIAYYGRHSCKMFIKGKPIRFGYKHWCLASSDGYCYQYMPYAGASTNKNPNYGLGENVVLQLLSNLETPAKHNVTFDNFFTSHKLMCRLNALGYFATGTVRDNRTNRAPLKDIKDMKKQERGTSDFRFDKNNNVLAVRWNDNSVVTILSNFLGHVPMCSAKRYDRKIRKMATIEQPLLIHAYNQRMGGVDLFDNAMNNYRIRVRGKKWYWPLLTNAFDAAMVNAWKLHVLCAKYEGAKPMSQFDFRLSVVEAMITLPEVRNPGGRLIANAQKMAKRMDRIDHVVDKMPKRGRCGQCGIKTQFGCNKCSSNLHPKCFLDYHNNVPRDAGKIKKAK